MTLSACLIVKNEAENLPRCLASLKDRVDEIIVVDTGSSDETVALAESHGAKVHHFAWCDDFSAARNFSLAQATGDWVLVIDADEELIVDQPDALSRALAGNAHAYCMQVENVGESGAIASHFAPLRLIRRAPGVQFAGRLHEDLSPAATSLGWKVVPLGCVRLRHYGYTNEMLQKLDKRARNARLARLMVEELPSDPNTWYQLARSLWLQGDREGAEEAIAHLDGLAEAGTRLDPIRERTFLLLSAWVHGASGDYPRALEVLHEGLARHPRYPEFLFERGRVHLELQALDAALADFEACLTAPRDGWESTVRAGVTGYLAHVEIVALHARRDRLDLVRPHLLAASRDPSCPPAEALRLGQLSLALPLPEETPAAPRLSACLIVKNEAENLPRCLESLKGWVDEIVVVDTGSTDETAAIAESYGAKVHPFTWCDDFSAARNATLDHATGDWVLVIDADEELVVEQPEAFRELLNNRGVWGYSLRQANASDDDATVLNANIIRLLRRDGAIRFQGRLHEQVAAAPGEWAASHTECVWLKHSGYLSAAIAAKSKAERNVRLARLAVQDAPHAPEAWLHLGRSLTFDGQISDAQAAYERVEALFAEAPAAEHEFWFIWLNGKYELLLRLEQMQEAEDLLDAGLERKPGFPGFLFERGKLRYNRGEVRGAIADFEACLASQGQLDVVTQSGISDALPREALARIAAHHPEFFGQAPRKRLSACLIVKNEAENLPRCLESLKGWVDEIVVVDTGSTDETAAIAESYGAKVHPFPWCDDFSAARNAALDHATGDWILVIDADEELLVEQPEALRAALVQPPTTFAMLIESLGESGTVEFQAPALRLFPRDARLRYTGRIHESLTNAMQAIALPSQEARFALLRHHGYRQEALAERAKAERNIRLARLEVTDRPLDALAHLNLARSLALAGQLAEALAAYGAVAVMPGGARGLGENLWTHFVLGLHETQQALGDAAGAEATLNGALAAKPGHPEFLFERGRLFAKQQRFEAARADLEACLAAHGKPFLLVRPGITDALPRQALAVVLKQLPPAPPSPQVARLLRALEQSPWNAEGFLELAFVFFQEERHDKALLAIAQSIELDANDTAAYHLFGLILNKLGQPGYAEKAFSAALQLDPDHPTALNCRLSCRKQQAEYELTPDQAQLFDRLLGRLYPTISACLIVKDEAENLPRCLTSLRDWVDEIVVVDTGSTDDTVAIAESFGAKVHHFRWCDDFSAARNAALDHATGDWILVVDADEELLVDDAEGFRKPLRQWSIKGYEVRVGNLCDDETTYLDSTVLRLFQRHEAIRFHGRLHESVDTTIIAQGWPISWTDALWLRHTGYLQRVITAKGKGDRNVRMARQAVAEAPESLDAWLGLARSLTFAGQLDEAPEAYARAESLLAQSADEEKWLVHLYGMFELYVRLQRLHEVERVIERGLSRHPDLAHLRYERGKLRYNRGDVPGAIADFQACLALHGKPQRALTLRGVTDTLPREALAKIAEQHPEAFIGQIQPAAQISTLIARKAPSPTLSACLIVKDEATNLSRCLASLRDWVDEIVVVDTGSTDDTVAIAQSHGAKVHHFTWCDDFSAARNVALAQATGDWVLVVDADEQLIVDRNGALRDALEAHGTSAYFMSVASVSAQGEVYDTPLIRLFRRDARIHFRGRLHEQVEDALREHHLSVDVVTGFWLRHEGYQAEALAGRDKVTRNLRIAEQDVAERPHASDAWLALARSYSAAGRYEDALSAFERLDALLSRTGDSADLAFVRCISLFEIYRQLKRPRDAEQALDVGLARNPDAALLRFHRGRLRRERGDLAGATADLQACLWACQSLAVSAGPRDLATQAQALLDQIIQHVPELAAHAEPDRKAALIARLSDNPRQAECFLELAFLFFQEDSLDKALLAIAQSIDLNASVVAAFHLLGLILAKLGQPGWAEKAFKTALQLDPDHPTALSSLLQCRKRQTEYELGPEQVELIERLLGRIYPTVSACLIVKDEAKNLPRCLDALQGWADEIVVVDTGSSDETVAIAESFGAKVHHFTWCDDFSAARNASLEHATGDWILAIDADEELVIEDAEAFRMALRNRECGGYICDQRNLNQEGRTLSNPVLRLFQRNERIRFARRLHEHVTDSLSALGWPVAGLEAIAIAHDGYLPEQTRLKGKHERNLRIAIAVAEANPDSADAWYNLARSSLMGQANLDEVLAAFARVDQLLAKGGTLGESAYITYVTLYQRQLRQVGRLAEAEALLDRAIARYPGQPELHYERGTLRAERGEVDGARADFSTCLTPNAYISAQREGITSELPRRALAELDAMVVSGHRD